MTTSPSPLSISTPFVAFVGAGASALPPSNLPGWTAFNTIVLESLCERLAEFSSNRQPTDAFLQAACQPASAFGDFGPIPHGTRLSPK